MKRVVDSLNLYAPVYEEADFLGMNIKSVSAYASSPIRLQVKNPESIVVPEDGPEEHYFIFDVAKNTVRVNGKTYPMNQWVESPFGKIRFTLNPNQSQLAVNDLYFVLVDPEALPMI